MIGDLSSDYRKGFGDGIKYSFIGKCIRAILLPWAMFTEKSNFGAGQINKIWQK